MPKHLNFKDYSVAYKIGLISILFLIFLFIIVLVSNKQLHNLGHESSIITKQEIPTVRVVHNLDTQIYQLSILRNQIYTADSEPVRLNKLMQGYNDLSEQIINSQHTTAELMKDYAKFEIPSQKRRWKRLQDDRQQEIQTSLDNILVTFEQVNELSQESFKFMNNDQQKVENAVLQILELDKVLHTEVASLTEATFTGISSSSTKVEHIDYGAVQLTYFLLFWFCLIGLIVSYFVIRMVIRRINVATEFANKIAEGEQNDKFEVTNQDELSQLMQALNNIKVSVDKADKQ